MDTLSALEAMWAERPSLTALELCKELGIPPRTLRSHFADVGFVVPTPVAAPEPSPPAIGFSSES